MHNMKDGYHSRVLRAAQICRDKGISQKEIASAVGASQSQVSRILSGNNQRASRLLEEVCLYVEKYDVGVTVEHVRRNTDLIEAMSSVWDGSSTHARALAAVIRSLSALGYGASKDIKGEES